MPTLVLLRHGQSRWNLENRFTGWVDVDLTTEGERQASDGGRLIAEAGILLDRAYTSVLTRAIRTCRLALEAADQVWIPEVKDWRLNERHYGGLTGLDKAETARIHGDEQVRIWRRAWDIPPPAMEIDSEWAFDGDRRYRGIAIPSTESTADTLARVLPYWATEVEPRLAAGESILVAAHGNSLRAVAKHLFGLGPEQVLALEIPTGNPLRVELSRDLKPVSASYLDAGRAEALPLS
jgi:2,3-bisphosphoglycerate-dependent phosphoglycerate mutase